MSEDVAGSLDSRLSGQGLIFPATQETSLLHLFKPKEAADRLRVKTRTIYSWILSGRLEAIKTPGGQIRIHACEVNRLLNDLVDPDSNLTSNTP